MGLGIAPDPVTMPSVAAGQGLAQSYGSTAPVALPPPPVTPPSLPAPAPAPAQAPQSDSAVPGWSENPLARLGFVLQSVSAGMQGRELPIVQLQRAKREQQQMALQSLQATLGLSSQLDGMDDTTRESFLKANGKTLATAGIDPASLKTIGTLDPERRALLDQISGDPTISAAALKLGGGTIKGAITFLGTDAGKQLVSASASDSADTKLRGLAAAVKAGPHAADFDLAAGKPMTASMIAHANSLLPKGDPHRLTGPELDAIAADPGRYGLTTEAENTWQAHFTQEQTAAMGARQWELAHRQAPQPPELVQLQNQRDLAIKQGDTKRAGEIQAYIDKTTQGGPQSQEYVNVQDKDGNIQSYIKGTSEAAAAVKAPGARVVNATLQGTVPTTDQANANTYATRMQQAEGDLNRVMATGYKPSVMELESDRLGSAQGLVVSKEFQQFDQARRNFINSILRRESGAAISPSEFENANKQYFPMPGDSPEVLDQKARNRQTAIEGMVSASGKAKPLETPAAPPPATGGAKKWKIVNGALVPE